jgi:O-antigen/teichoic acid export membrane protein
MKSFLASIHNNYLNIKKDKNIIWILALNLIAGASQLIVYKQINVKSGQEHLGIWALILTIYTIGQISNLNFSSGLIRYVPEYLIAGDNKKVIKMFGTTKSSILIISPPLLLVIYILSVHYAKGLLNSNNLIIFSRSIIWVLTAILFNNFFSAYTCLFDGFQKFYTRCMIQISGWMIFLLTSIYFFGEYGLEGVGIAMFIQSIWQLIFAIIIVKKVLKLKKIYYFCFDNEAFKIVASFGIKFQTIGILSSLTDPIIKYFITQKLGLSGVANYEIANKITSQLRSLLISSNQVLIPKLIQVNSTAKFDNFFRENIKRTTFFSVSLGFLTLLLTPFLIYYITKKIDYELFVYVVIFNIGGVFNMITSLHYFSCIAFDKLRSLINMHLLYLINIITFYIITNNINMQKVYYMIFPSINLIFASLYNTYLLKNKKGVFDWVFSKHLLVFMILSIILLYISCNNIYF